MKIKYFLLSLILVSVSSFSAETVSQSVNGFLNDSVSFVTKPFVKLSQQEIECMARNIFYEAGSESVEGKVAVAMVTINRTQDPNFPSNVCNVVKQKTIFSTPKIVKTTQTIKTGWFTPDKEITETKTTWVQRVVCQFSWTCVQAPKIKQDDPRWIESQEVAKKLVDGDYEEYREKYENAKHFHAVSAHPGWKLKKIARTGNHIFYE
jgi:hypothetical protein